MTVDWEHVLYDWIPKIESTTSSMDYYTALHEITSKINDNHIWFWHPTLPLLPDAPSLSGTIPVLLLKVQDKVIVAQIDSSAGPKFPLAIGDEILAIDGQNTAEMEATIEGIRARKDEVLQKAVETLNRKIKEANH